MSYDVLNALRVLQDLWAKRLTQNLGKLPIGQRLGVLNLVLDNIALIQPMHDITCEDIMKGVAKYNDGKPACDQIPTGIHGMYFCSNDEAIEQKRKDAEVQAKLAAEEARLAEVRTRLEMRAAADMEGVMKEGVKVLVLKNRVPRWVQVNELRESIVKKTFARNPGLHVEMERLAMSDFDIYFQAQVPGKTLIEYCAERLKEYGEPASYVRMKVFENAFNIMRDSLPETEKGEVGEESDYFSDIDDEVDQEVPKVGIYPPPHKPFAYERQAMVPTIVSISGLSLKIRAVAEAEKARAAAVIFGGGIEGDGVEGDGGGAAAVILGGDGGGAAAVILGDIMIIDD